MNYSIRGKQLKKFIRSVFPMHITSEAFDNIRKLNFTRRMFHHINLIITSINKREIILRPFFCGNRRRLSYIRCIKSKWEEEKEIF